MPTDQQARAYAREAESHRSQEKLKNKKTEKFSGLKASAHGIDGKVITQ